MDAGRAGWIGRERRGGGPSAQPAERSSLLRPAPARPPSADGPSSQHRPAGEPLRLRASIRRPLVPRPRAAPRLRPSARRLPVQRAPDGPSSGAGEQLRASGLRPRSARARTEPLRPPSAERLTARAGEQLRASARRPLGPSSSLAQPQSRCAFHFQADTTVSPPRPKPLTSPGSGSGERCSAARSSPPSPHSTERYESRAPATLLSKPFSLNGAGTPPWSHPRPRRRRRRPLHLRLEVHRGRAVEVPLPRR